MEKRTEIAQLVCVGVPAGDRLGEALRLLRSHPPGMVILFAHNIGPEPQVRDLCGALHALPGRPLVAIDMEGGRVNRLKGLWGDLPGGSEYGRWSEAKIERFAFDLGRRLGGLGIDIDFAPVADLGPATPGTGLEGRVLGDDPALVAGKARAFLRGLHRGGVLGCVKHYPGLGASTLDSHLTLPRIDLSRRALARHLRPFRLLKAEAPMVMVAHALYPALDPSGKPSTLSRPVIGLLDRRPAYRGLILSDDLEMGALAAYGPLAERARKALAAGCHTVIVSHRWEELPAVAEGLRRAPHRAALERWTAWRSRWSPAR
jgi:beta-N-acetylhexosaminidase